MKNMTPRNKVEWRIICIHAKVHSENSEKLFPPQCYQTLLLRVPHCQKKLEPMYIFCCTLFKTIPFRLGLSLSLSPASFCLRGIKFYPRNELANKPTHAYIQHSPKSTRTLTWNIGMAWQATNYRNLPKIDAKHCSHEYKNWADFWAV